MLDRLTVRAERLEDSAAIREVVVAAFEAEFEADLIEAIRVSDGYVPELSVVAVLDGEIVGHAMISRVSLVDGATRRVAHSLAPVAVAPAVQRRGIGRRLVRHLVEAADGMGLPLVTVEGDPAFYGRFGFEPAAPHGIHMELPDWAPPEAAQIVRLARYTPSFTGRIEYPPAFGADPAA